MALKHSTMTLYSDPMAIASHRVRIALAEKGVAFNLIDIDSREPSEDLLAINPYNSLPTLADRNLVLYEPTIITEYLDERFPHPPLLPVYPVARAKCRLLIHRIEQDWLSLANLILKGGSAAERAHEDWANQLSTVAPIFAEAPYFLSEDFTLADCCLAPLLWRLPYLEIKLPAKKAKPIIDYMERVFARDAFQTSLSDLEREIGEES